MITDTFQTIQTDYQGIYKEKGSKFISFAFPVTCEEEIKSKLTQLQKKYHDARHHCYAYRLGTDSQNYRFNDDGEPSGTAGRPIMGQIESNNLTNILLVVVRYFGGKLLGTPGLIRAYRSAAADCLSQAQYVKCRDEITLEIFFPYESINSVMRVAKQTNVVIAGQDFNQQCKMKLIIDKSQFESIKEQLSGINNGKINIL